MLTLLCRLYLTAASVEVGQWHYIGPYSIGSGGDPLAAYGGIEKTWAKLQSSKKQATFPSEFATGGRIPWQRLKSGKNGVVQMQQLPGKSIGWAVADASMSQEGCVVIKCVGMVQRLWIQSVDSGPVFRRGLPVNSEYRLQLTARKYVLFAQVVGNQWSLSMPSCPYTPVPIRPLPLAIDDWNKGHELPDIVDGRLFSQYIALGVRNLGLKLLRNVSLHVLPNEFVPGSFSLHAMNAAPQQMLSLASPIRLRANVTVLPAACPLAVTLKIMSVDDAGNVVGTEQKYRLACKAIDDRFSFVYLTDDGSPQMASAKFPKGKMKAASCPAGGCGVLLSTHGMDVTCQRQADCYKPKRGVWILAPHGRGTHAMNWQGPGHWSALKAFEALGTITAARYPSLTPALPPHARVVWTGHSNGGFGAWMLASRYPDWSLGCAPLAGMATLSTTQPDYGAAASEIEPMLYALLDTSVAEYRGDLSTVPRNLLGIPFLARTGANDRTISPWMTRRMSKILCEASGHPHGGGDSKAKGSGACTMQELAGKDHWWWDTKTENDGGVMDDKRMQRFFNGAFANRIVPLANLVDFSCLNLASCGARAGIKLMSQAIPARMSRLRIQTDIVGENGVEWVISTQNVRKLLIQRTTWLENVSAISIGSSRFEVGRILKAAETQVDYAQEVQHAALLCWDAEHGRKSGEWVMCLNQQCVEQNDGAKCQPPPGCCTKAAEQRGLQQFGPLRRVFSRPFLLVVGTLNVTEHAEMHNTAVLFANDFYITARGTPQIVNDTAVSAMEHQGYNIILFGDPASNAVTRQQSLDGHLPVKFGGGGHRWFRLGPCKYSHPDDGVVTLAPWGGKKGLLALVAGNSISGFHEALRNFRSDLFTTNSWQHRLPDYVVTGAESKWRGIAGLGAAGYWGDDWEYRQDAGHVSCLL
jgi:pimeloyl-ACP methyl ester carboxylesterase